jgi:DNA replication protein DnaC
MNIEFLKSLDIPEEVLSFKCDRHDHDTVGYCETCLNEEKEKKMIEDTLNLHLAEIEPEFREKFGKGFSIEDFEPTNPKKKAIGDSIKKFINSHIYGDSKEIRGLIFYGNQGNGKSMLSNLIQFEALKAGKRARRITQFDLYNQFLEDRRIIEYYKEPDFLFLDEIGRINNSDYAQNAFFDLVNHRYSKLKQTIITTNLKKNQLSEFVDSDRMKEFRIVEFNWDSRRGR